MDAGSHHNHSSPPLWTIARPCACLLLSQVTGCASWASPPLPCAARDIPPHPPGKSAPQILPSLSLPHHHCFLLFWISLQTCWLFFHVEETTRSWPHSPFLFLPSLPPSFFFFFTREVLKCVFILISLIPLFLHLLKPLQSDFCCHLSNQTYHDQGPWDLNIAPFRAKRPCPSHLTCSRMTCECAVHAGTYLRGNGGLGMITPGPQVQTGIVQGK